MAAHRKAEEGLDKGFTVRWTVGEEKEISEEIKTIKNGEFLASKNDVVRHYFKKGKDAARTESPLPGITVHLFNATAPCGQWTQTATDQHPFEVSGEMAELLGLLDGDWVVPCVGDSMVGADIPDGSTLVMRPLGDLEPENGDVCLAQVILLDGGCLWTVKRWKWQGATLELQNGRREKLSLPDDAIELRAIAFKVATLKHGRK